MSIPRRNLSAVSFIDYFRLRYDADKKDINLYDTVLQHKKDKIEFEDCYQTLKYLLEDKDKKIQDLVNSMESILNLSSDAIGCTLELLVKKRLLDSDEVQQTLNKILKMYEEDNKIKNTKKEERNK